MGIKSTLLNNPWLKKTSREIRIYFELKVIEYSTFQNLWDATKSFLGRKFIDLNAYERKEKQSLKLMT